MTSTEESIRIFSNLQIFYEIAKESFEESVKNLEKNRTTKPGGGYVLTYDPKRLSFKNGLISTSFSDSYIDLYIRMVYITRNHFSPEAKWDRKTNKDKLEDLGITDSEFLQSVEDFRKVRNSIAHEKPLVFGQQSSDAVRGTAQDSARMGMSIIETLQKVLPLVRISDND